MTKIGAIISSYNRKEHTVNCLSELQKCAAYANVRLTVVLFDDGSTDGTPEEVNDRFPQVYIQHGDGSAYWAQSMANAEKHLLKIDDEVDFVLWLNDDVRLDLDSITRLLCSYQRNKDAIIIGAVRDPITSNPTYGGFRQHQVKPLKFLPVKPGSWDQEIDTFNGNLVLIPAPVARLMVGIDGEYAHALADIDYGLRARQLGVSRILAPGTFGECPRNAEAKWKGVQNEFRTFTSKKGGGHPASLKRILRKLRPITWPIHFASIYTTWVYRTLKKAVKSNRAFIQEVR